VTEPVTGPRFPPVKLVSPYSLSDRPVRSLFVSSGLLGSLLAVVGVGLAMGPTGGSDSSPRDGAGAMIQTERMGDRLRVRGVFVNDGVGAETLRYELSVRRTGAAGTSRSSQSGTFETAPGRTDTLSTTQVNVQPGDEIDLKLIVRRQTTQIDSARLQRAIW